MAGERAGGAAGSAEDGDASHLIAGAAAGCFATILLHPLDLVKTRMQVQEFGNRRLPMYNSLVHACRTIFRLEGLRGLYQGVWPNVIGSTVSWGMYMHLYNEGKVRIKSARPHTPDSAVYVAAASCAGAATSLVVHPLFTIKTRLQLELVATARAAAEGSSATANLVPLSQRDNYETARNALRRMLREEGWGSLYRGLGPSLILVSHASIQFLAYEHAKHALSTWRESRGDAWRATGRAAANASAGGGKGGGASSSSLSSWSSSSRGLSFAELTLAATASKIVATLATYPYQVLRTYSALTFLAVACTTHGLVA